MTVNVDTQSLIASMRDVVGQAYLLTDKAKKQPYTKGFRFGAGEALAVVRPGTLVEIWRVLKLCVEADVAVIMQAANTGLTGALRQMVKITTGLSLLSVLCVLMIFS